MTTLAPSRYSLTYADVRDNDSWDDTVGDTRGQCHKRWLVSPQHGRFMRKRTLCSSDDGGAEREVIVASAAAACGLLSYSCIALDDRDVLVQHVEDANPEWESLGNFYEWRHDHVDALPADVWLPYATFSIVFGVEDRNTTNSMVMRHRETGQLQLASIDHECACESGTESWPTFAINHAHYNVEPALYSKFEAELDAMLGAAMQTEFADYINYDSIEYYREKARNGTLGGVLAV